MEKWRVARALVDFESPRKRSTTRVVRGHCPRARNVHSGEKLVLITIGRESYFNTRAFSVDLYSPVFCAIIGSIASNTTRKIGVILTTFFPAFPRSPVITAHLTPQQRATYEKINHLRHKHTTFITEGENEEKTMTRWRLPDEDLAANVTLDNDR